MCSSDLLVCLHTPMPAPAIAGYASTSPIIFGGNDHSPAIRIHPNLTERPPASASRTVTFSQVVFTPPITARAVAGRDADSREIDLIGILVGIIGGQKLSELEAIHS